MSPGALGTQHRLSRRLLSSPPWVCGPDLPPSCLPSWLSWWLSPRGLFDAFRKSHKPVQLREACPTLALPPLVQQRGQDVVRVLMDGAKGTITQEATQETVRDLSALRASVLQSLLGPRAPGESTEPMVSMETTEGFSHSDPKTETIREGVLPG